jgi:hypothetical protein
MYLVGRAHRANADARAVVDRMKDMMKLQEGQLTRTKSNWRAGEMSARR